MPKNLIEERCSVRPEDKTVGECGVFTGGIQCANCTKQICFDHAQVCRTCRDECRNHLFCPDCVHCHKCADIEKAA